MIIEKVQQEIFSEVERLAPELIPPLPPEFRRLLLNFGDTYVIWLDHAPVGLGGIVPVVAGVGEMWAYYTDTIKARPRLLVDASRWLIDEFENELGYHRLQVAIDCQDKKALRFVEFLGFEGEGVMKSYGINKEDHYRLGRVS